MIRRSFLASLFAPLLAVFAPKVKACGLSDYTVTIETGPAVVTEGQENIDIVYLTLQAIGVIVPNESVTDWEMRSCLNSLKSIRERWASEGITDPSEMELAYGLATRLSAEYGMAA